MSDKTRDRELGMYCKITRRDFLDGIAIAGGGSILATQAPWVSERAGSSLLRKAMLTTIRPRSWACAATTTAAMRSPINCETGTFWKSSGKPEDTRKICDLVVVGGGISGLASAYFYRKAAGAKARVLILENHDDFGGLAKRNEFRVGRRVRISNGGTQSKPYRPAWWQVCLECALKSSASLWQSSLLHLRWWSGKC